MGIMLDAFTVVSTTPRRRMCWFFGHSWMLFFKGEPDREYSRCTRLRCWGRKVRWRTGSDTTNVDFEWLANTRDLPTKDAVFPKTKDKAHA